jgi:hypothetical protein
MTLLHHIPYQAMVSEDDQLSQILKIRIKVQTVVKSIRTLPIFSIYFSYKTSFSKYYLEVNSCPISIIILSTKAERYVVYSSNFEITF